MSTTFGIHKYGSDIILQDDILPDIYDREEDFIVVARRWGGFYWLNDLASFLPSNTRVYPLDNSAEGIRTIGDISERIEQFDIK